MRVTENTNFETVRSTIRDAKGRLDTLQGQAATMKKLNTPSDDPIAAAKILEVRTDKVLNEQFVTNGKLAETQLASADHALAEMADLVVRAKEIAIGQASGASSNSDTRHNVAEEVTQLFNQAVAAANRRIGDRYIFSGYKTNRPAVDESGKYRGDDGQIMVEIAKGVFLTTNVPGIDAFNTQPQASNDRFRDGYPENGVTVEGRSLSSINAEGAELPPGAPENVNLFDELQSLRVNLLTGNLEGIRDSLDRLDQVHSKLISTRSKVGSRLQGLQSANLAAEKQNVTNAQLASALEDADMAQVMSDMAKEETVYRSALQSAQKLIQPTLMDFLK